ncbi:MAG: ferrous iron transport protein B [Candidatus Thermoplasmatota archaeon]
MKDIKVLVIGQPNVGKSSLLDSLAGSSVEVSNYPGTTVELTKAKKVLEDTRITFVDTPGIYSISDRSEEEKVTEKALFESEVDGAIVIADAVSLERSLYIVLQILEAGIPVLVALNFVEDAEERGIRIDRDRLEKLLNVPVTPINPLTKMGTDELLDLVKKIDEVPGRTYEIEYDDHIERAIDKISPYVESRLPERFVSIRALEEDEHFYKYVKDLDIVEETKEELEEHPEVSKDISITRFGTASFIAEKVTEMKPIKEEKTFEDKIDNFLLDDVWGPVSTGVSFLVMFGVLLYLGNFTQDILMRWTEKFLGTIGGTSSFLSMLLFQGLTGLMAGISIALPYVFLFYILLGLLEDIGILPRFIANVDRFFKKIGLPGKSFIPLMLGLGCTAPATRATRVLSSKEEQYRTSSFFAFVPCSSRIAIIMGVVGFYGDVWLAISVFATLLVAGLIWAYGLKKITGSRGDPLLLELPPYRKPKLKNVLTKGWIRMKDFVYIVIPLLALGGIAYGALKTLGFTHMIVDPLSPIAVWLGLPAVLIVPLFFGFLQKDLTGAMLVSVLGGGVSSALTSIQLYTFGVAASIGIPCIIALGMLWKEFGIKKAFLLTGTTIAYGLLVAGLIWRIASVL